MNHIQLAVSTEFAYGFIQIITTKLEKLPRLRFVGFYSRVINRPFFAVVVTAFRPMSSVCVYSFLPFHVSICYIHVVVVFS